MRITIVPLVGLLLVFCAGPKQTLEPTAAPAQAKAWTTVQASPTTSGADVAKPAAPLHASKDDAASLPEGFVAVPQPSYDARDEATFVFCGELRVENRRGNPDVFEPFVVVTDTTTGKQLYEARGRRYDVGVGATSRMALTASACGDVTGDGVAELLLTERTLGAHCCYTHYVTSMTSPTKLILKWEKGDSGDGIWPVKLKPGAAWQLQSVDLVWPPFDVEKGDPAVPYALIPGFPIVFDLGGGHYQKSTFTFLDALKNVRDAAREACTQRPDCEPYELYEWGMAVMFDEWDAQKANIVRDAELRRVLDRRAIEMKQKMRAQLGG